MTTTAIVFPGQGAQRPGMAADFFMNFPRCREVFSVASQTLDLDMQEICFSEHPDLNRTEVTQPAILTAEISMYCAVKDHIALGSTIFGGHSLGEYAALVAADVICFEDALRIVRKRGQLMQAAVPEGVGAMVALLHDNLAQNSLRELLQHEEVQIANNNSPSQIVLSGRKARIASVCRRLREMFPKLTIIELNVSAPFHCGLMKGIEQEFEAYLRSFAGRFNLAASAKVVSNFTGKFHQPETVIEALVLQISGCVNWISNMKGLMSRAARVIEVGPTRILGKFFGSLGLDVPSLIDVRSMKKYARLGGSRNELCQS
jgi:[acyl-carrier-protein] S-malonyltransferase